MSIGRAAVVKLRLRREGFIELELFGRCMEPFLLSGDVVRIRFVDEVDVGDICLVELENGALALHRVVKKMGDSVFTKGDYSGLIEERGIRYVFGCADAFRFRDGHEWVEYRQSFFSKKMIARLSLAISAGEKRKIGGKANAGKTGGGGRWGFVKKKICRRLLWRRGARLRRRMTASCGHSA